MKYWLIKSDPDTFSFHDMLKEKETQWDGVRNYAARNFLREMKRGDTVLVYHSGGESKIMGLATVTAEHFPDPTADSDTWLAVKLKAGKLLKSPVDLSSIKKEPKLSEIPLIKISRLSVMPIEEKDFKLLLKMAGE
ncbi:MAG: EVE domain-containing protein [Bacteroidetes bacterium]|nr:MAG: EVE domain-containing protein [Bacteroidota bacterium]REK06541.1 MAG: EVE domain-containing protein [Bacteroidota bacterium]REK33307.1 MAG: EVE domain-containing protein [Bacteroidota bacterium]REK49707.1 MAG: EVE domain-containing protein [Bacteroidota bacterium]